MSYRRNGLKALGLSVIAALGLMAFMAAGAQASEKSWLVEGVDLAANETVSVTAHTDGVLAVPAKNIRFLCKVVAAEGLKLVATAEVKAEGKVKFSECTAFEISTGKEQKNCKPAEPIIAGGSAALILHNTQNYILFAPEAGKPFTTITLSELCALTETSPVTGSLVAECLTSALVHEDCNTSEVTHLIQPVASTTLFEADKLKFGANPATLTGVAAVKLSGANVNKKWAGHI